MIRTISLSLLVTGASLSAQSGWKTLDGQPAPAVTASDWINADGEPSVSALKGKVWLLYFFATT